MPIIAHNVSTNKEQQLSDSRLLTTVTQILLLLLALTLTGCSDESEQTEKPVTQVALPKNPAQDYDYLLNEVQITDHYMWLEQKTPQRTQWIEQQLELSTQYFDGLGSILDEVSLDDSQFNQLHPQQFLYHYFYIKENPVTGHSFVASYDAIKEIEVQLGSLPDGITAHATRLSPLGRFLAIQGVNRQGLYRWLLFDLAQQQFSNFRFAATKRPTQFYWLNGFNRFIYQTEQQVYYQNLGKGPEFNQLLFDLNQHLEDTNGWHIAAHLTADSRHLVVIGKHLVKNSDTVWVLPLEEQSEHQTAVVIAQNTRASFNFVGSNEDTFYFHTNLVAPRWRIISIDLQRPSRRDWKEVIPQQKELLTAAFLLDNRWLLQYLDNTQQRIFISQLNGTSRQPIAVSDISDLHIQTPQTMANGKLSILVSINAFEHPARILSLSLEQKQLSESLTELNAVPDIVTETVFYRSADGSRIPLTLAHRKGLDKNGENHTLLMTNQGFGSIQLPYYQPLFVDWLNNGGILAIAHIRGGGVYGESWRQSVSGQKHARAVEDIIAAVDWLANNNYSKRQYVAAYGSHFSGSLMMEAAIMAPQNFRALVLEDIEANYLNYLEQANPLWMKEFELKSDQASTEWFLAVSPYHRLANKNYPAVLLIDSNPEPSVSSYKTLARWQNQQLSSKPVVLLTQEVGRAINDTSDFGFVTQESIKHFLSNELKIARKEQQAKN